MIRSDYTGLRPTAIRDCGHTTHTWKHTGHPPESDSLGHDSYYGNGRINAFRALLSVMRGDVNNDGVHDIVDVVSIINVAFRNGSTPGLHRGLYDMVCDGIVCDIADVVAIINVAIRNGKLPAPCFEYEY